MTPPAAPDVTVVMPDPSIWSNPAIYSAIAAGLSLVIAGIAAWNARQARIRDADVALLDLYEKVTADTVKSARTKVFEWQKLASAKVPAPLENIHAAYFELVWVMDLVYEALHAHKIDPEKAKRVLGFHLGQIQIHIATVHRVQDDKFSDSKSLNNIESRPRYQELRDRHDGQGRRYAGLRVTDGNNTRPLGERQFYDPALDPVNRTTSDPVGPPNSLTGCLRGASIIGAVIVGLVILAWIANWLR